tara:strand:- start:102898 stop:104100 length:1203 start_codon:yes stop_codon:yes gene_type:complete
MEDQTFNIADKLKDFIQFVKTTKSIPDNIFEYVTKSKLTGVQLHSMAKHLHEYYEIHSDTTVLYNCLVSLGKIMTVENAVSDGVENPVSDGVSNPVSDGVENADVVSGHYGLPVYVRKKQYDLTAAILEMARHDTKNQVLRDAIVELKKPSRDLLCNLNVAKCAASLKKLLPLHSNQQLKKLVREQRINVRRAFGPDRHPGISVYLNGRGDADDLVFRGMYKDVPYGYAVAGKVGALFTWEALNTTTVKITYGTSPANVTNLASIVKCLTAEQRKMYANLLGGTVVGDKIIREIIYDLFAKSVSVELIYYRNTVYFFAMKNFRWLKNPCWGVPMDFRLESPEIWNTIKLNCQQCGTEGTPENRPRRCGGCATVRYCSGRCQRIHRREHLPYCSRDNNPLL